MKKVLAVLFVGIPFALCLQAQTLTVKEVMDDLKSIPPAGTNPPAVQPTDPEPVAEAAEADQPDPAAPVITIEPAPIEIDSSPVEETPAMAEEDAIEEIQEDLLPADRTLEEQTPAMAEEEAPVDVIETVEPVDTVAVEETVPLAEDTVVETDEIGLEDDVTTDAQILGGRVSLNLNEVELQDVIRLFGRLSNANIIVPDLGDEAAAAKVDVSLSNVEWKPALQAILDTHDLELYEKIPGTDVYSIREKSADAPDPMEVKTFKLNYATVGEVLEMIQTLVPEPGKISVFPARNTIVVQSTAQNLVEVQEMISAIDLPRQQVFIEAKFMELSDSASEQLGIDWQVLGGYNVGVNNIAGEYSYTDSREDTVSRSYTSGENRYRDVAGRTYEQLEENPGSDPIDFNERLGNTTDDSRIFGITPTTFSETLNSVTALDTEVVTKALGATLNASDFNLVLAALRETGGSKIVSNPKIIVANEEMATIHIGQKKPNVKGTTQTAGDSQVITTYALDEDEPYFEDGIQVRVTPTINTEDNITVKIEPTLDRLDTVPFTAPDGTEFYGKSTKTIETLFSLKSGQTAAIGGLTETSADDVDRKVPLLGNLPVIGRFFSYSSKQNAQAETIIFVTVGLANPDDVNMETGLPQNSDLAMRYEIQREIERKIKAEERLILQKQEAERLEERLRTLREAEQQRIEKKAAEAAETAAVE